MSFYIGQPRPFRWSEVKHITTYEDMKEITHGDIIETLGHIVEWDDNCVPVELCESWRHVGDPACDAALREVFSHPSETVGKDLLQALQDYAVVAHGTCPATNAFLSEVLHLPPPGLLVSEQEAILAQELFIDDSIQIMQALLYYSLAGGLASPRIVRTLEAVSYLVPHFKKGNGISPPTLSEMVSQISKESSDRTFTRLVETLQFILDVMDCTVPTTPIAQSTSTNALESEFPKGASWEGPWSSSSSRLAYLLPGGLGWKSAVRVRLLHGVARWRVQTRWEREKGHEVLDSVPISQEEISATLASFSTIPMWCLRRLHLPPSPQHASAYLALWRHVGYYMGVSPSILLPYFSNTDAADKFIATAALNLFFEEFVSASPSEGVPTAVIKGPTIPILVAVSHRPPLNTSLDYNIALTTHLLGTPLARHLGLPETSVRTRLFMHGLLLAQRLPHHFARWYPRRGWLEKRRALLREGMMYSVRWNMGQRHSAFRPRTMTGQDDGGGELAPGVAEAERVERDPARSAVLTRQWKEVFVEMVAVCASACIVTSVLAYHGIKYASVATTAILHL